MKKTLGLKKVLSSLLLTLTVLTGVMPAAKVNAAATPRVNNWNDPRIQIVYLNNESAYYWNGDKTGSADYVICADVYVNQPQGAFITRIDGAIVNNNQYVMGPLSKTVSRRENLTSHFSIGPGFSDVYWPFCINQLDPSKIYTLQVGVTYSDGSVDHFSREFSIKKIWPIKCTDKIKITHNGLAVRDIEKGDTKASVKGKFESKHPIVRIDVAVYKNGKLVAVLRVTNFGDLMNPNISRFNIGQKLGLANYSKGDYTMTITAMDNTLAYATSSVDFKIV